MRNPILEALEGSPSQRSQQPMTPEVLNAQPTNNLSDLKAEFGKFTKSLAGKDPLAMMQNLISSGQMTRELFMNLKSKAEGLINILK